MKNKLEEFVHRNRDDFDADAPGRDLWKHIEKHAKRTEPKVFNLFTIKQIAAAALVLVNATVIFFLLQRKPADIPMGSNTPTEQVTTQPYEEEIDQISKVVEIKQAKLKEIGKINPVLYKTFVGALNQLNKEYTRLEKELSTNPNKEDLLEAMIQNLSLQHELLNQQLGIYQKFNQTNHEKNTKTL
jgi:hypothetical protein